MQDVQPDSCDAPSEARWTISSCGSRAPRSVAVPVRLVLHRKCHLDRPRAFLRRRGSSCGGICPSTHDDLRSHRVGRHAVEQGIAARTDGRNEEGAQHGGTASAVRGHGVLPLPAHRALGAGDESRVSGRAVCHLGRHVARRDGDDERGDESVVPVHLQGSVRGSWSSCDATAQVIDWQFACREVALHCGELQDGIMDGSP